jgi:hypothetical protein
VPTSGVLITGLTVSGVTKTVTGSAKNIISFVEREVTLIGLGLGIRWIILLLMRMFLLGLLVRCYLKYRTAVGILLRLRGWRCVKSGDRRRTFGHLFAFLSDIFSASKSRNWNMYCILFN